MSECLTYTLSEVTDRFLNRNLIDRKKNFSKYLILAEECWEDIFQNTLWSIKSVWMPTKAGSLYNYVYLPKDCLRLLSVSVDDKCGLTQPLFYNPQISVVAKPTDKKCGCTCDCEGLCDAVNSMTTTSKLIFTINGVPYYQTCWTKYCPNGDIIEYCKTPAKKYNNLIGDGGDFNDDYNDDYLIGNPPFSDYTIVYVESQMKICKLEVKPCGCPKETPENEKLFFDCCGAWVNWNCHTKRKHCREFYQNINNNHFGEINLSECGAKVYYKPSHNWNRVAEKEIPDYLLVNYQSTGTLVGAETLIPKYSRNAMYASLDNGRKEYNSYYSQVEKDAAYYKKCDEINKLTAYLSPITLSDMAAMQDINIKW
jgi:hypothetical protein